MKKKLLIVEDDQYFREAMRDLLEKKYNVLEAPNGKSAKTILLVQNVDVVLSDIQMPGLTGLELLEWAKENIKTPFIIMTGFSMVLETKTAFELGAKGFIAKPFKNEELFAVIDSILEPDQNKTTFPVEENKKNYCKVSINEFVSRPVLEFDVYIKLSEEKLIKIAQKGQEIQKERVDHYRDKGVKYLHILAEDFGKLVNFNQNLNTFIKGRADVSKEKKLSFLKYSGEVLLEKTFIEGLDKGAYLEAKNYIDLSLSAVAESSDSLSMLNLLNDHSDFIYAHSLGVSLYSVLIAKKLGIESPSTFFKLGLAGFFHDIGKKEIDRELLEKPRHLVSHDERKIIEGHVIRGQEILSNLPSMPSDVIQLVAEHHEDAVGQGFPLRKSKLELHPLSKILQCANAFIEQTLAGPTGGGKSAASACTHLETIMATRLDPACVKALKSLFNL